MDELTAENPNSIRKMFGAIAGKYDLANSVLSLGIHHLWKKALVKKSGIRPGDRVLDCATGTGDLAFRFENVTRGQARVTGSDFCEPMLTIAREKAAKMGSQVEFIFADAMSLPFENQSFDLASISFGLRNVKDLSQALCELGRVVRPGGQVLILEFGQPTSKVMGALFHFYSTRLLPQIGGWISGEKKAYEYLQTSSAQFPCGEKLLELAERTGRFSNLEYRSFQGGIAYLYCLTCKESSAPAEQKG
ncbi:MAG: bifunctional demethylmenaquinone methyltransferase/2-methoxy-6-polyprenyl-1,4-benzoquinol methylase UbiE [Bdellovibrionia bacterium]